MGSEDNATAHVCPHCGERRPANQFYQFQDGTISCLSCLVKQKCGSCGKEVVTIEDSTGQNGVYCETCAGDTESTHFRANVLSLIKRGSLAIIGLLFIIAVRIGDELLVLLLRSLDEIVRFFSSVSQEFVGLRPLLAPAFAFHQNVFASGILLSLLFGALLVIFVDSLFSGGVRLFHIVTFPGTVVHEWGHKKICDQYGLEVTNVVYFQLKNPLGIVEYRGSRTFWQEIGVNIAPLLFNTVVAISIATIGTVFSIQLRLWGLVLIYWLAFSVGTGAFPSHADIDNIWDPILNQWRQDPKMLLAIPLVLLLRLILILKVAYLEAIYGICLVFTGIIIGQIVG